MLSLKVLNRIILAQTRKLLVLKDMFICTYVVDFKLNSSRHNFPILVNPSLIKMLIANPHITRRKTSLQ